jgi:hypothetical protein
VASLTSIASGLPVPHIQIVQAIGKIFERSVLRQHEGKRTVCERHSQVARARLVLMEIRHGFSEYW